MNKWKLLTVRISVPVAEALDIKARKLNLTLGEYSRHMLSESLSNTNQTQSNNSNFDSSKIEDDIKKMGTQIQNLLNVFSEDVDKNFEEQKNVIKNLGSQLNNFAQAISQKK